MVHTCPPCTPRSSSVPRILPSLKTARAPRRLLSARMLERRAGAWFLSPCAHPGSSTPTCAVATERRARNARRGAISLRAPRLPVEARRPAFQRPDRVCCGTEEDFGSGRQSRPRRGGWAVPPPERPQGDHDIVGMYTSAPKSAKQTLTPSLRKSKAISPITSVMSQLTSSGTPHPTKLCCRRGFSYRRNQGSKGPRCLMYARRTRSRRIRRPHPEHGTPPLRLPRRHDSP